MYRQYTLDTNPFTDGKGSAVFTVISKHSLNRNNRAIDSNYALNFQYIVVLIGSVRTNAILPLAVCGRVRVQSISDIHVA